MARYAQRLKDQAVARLLPPESATVDTVAHELGIGVATLERWRAEALGAPRTERMWTAVARWEAMIATAALDETARNAWCREQGLYPSDLEAWRDQAIAALATPTEARARPEETRCYAPILSRVLVTSYLRRDDRARPTLRRGIPGACAARDILKREGESPTCE